MLYTFSNSTYKKCLLTSLIVPLIFSLFLILPNYSYSQNNQSNSKLQEEIERSKKAIDNALDFSATGLGRHDDFIAEMKKSYGWELVTKEISQGGIPYQMWKYDPDIILVFYFNNVKYDAQIIAIATIRKALPVEPFSVFTYLDSKSTYRKVSDSLYKMLYHSNELMGERTSLGDFTDKEVYFSVALIPDKQGMLIRTTVMCLDTTNSIKEAETLMNRIFN